MNCFQRGYQGTTSDYNIIDQSYNASNTINLKFRLELQKLNKLNKMQ